MQPHHRNALLFLIAGCVLAGIWLYHPADQALPPAAKPAHDWGGYVNILLRGTADELAEIDTQYREKHKEVYAVRQTLFGNRRIFHSSGYTATSVPEASGSVSYTYQLQYQFCVPSDKLAEKLVQRFTKEGIVADYNRNGYGPCPR